MRAFLVAAAFLVGCDGETERPVDAGSDGVPCDVWRPGPRLLAHREGSPAFLVDGGRVLVVAGHFDNRTGDPVNSSELLDAALGESQLTGSFNFPRSTTGVGPTLQLGDGRVLSGTPWNWPDQPLIPTEIWDAASGEWSASGPQNVPAAGPGVVLGDGRVLVSGGIVWDSFNGGEDHASRRTEVWDPATGQWTLAGEMTTPRTGHALVLVDGEAMAIGGFAEYPGGSAVATCEVFDAETGTWSSAATLTAPRTGPVVTLRDGRLFSAGGTSESGGSQRESAEAAVYDPETRMWESVAPMLEARAQHHLTVLADGRVLVTGGSHQFFSYSTDSAEIFDPATGTWSLVAAMQSDRRAHGAVLLPSGEVLVIGGYPGGVFTSEIYRACPR